MSLAGEALAVVAQLAVGAGLGSAARWGRTQVRTRQPAARIWAINRNRPVHIITGQDETDLLSEFTVKVFPAEYLAAVEVRTLLRETLRVPKVRLCTSRDFAAKDVVDNLVCIGGPIHNKVTSRILDRLDAQVSFDGHDVVSKVTGARYEAAIDERSGQITRDIGVIVLDRNPFAPECSVALVMGLRTFGCPAGSRILTSGQLTATERALGAGPHRWAILDADVIDDFVARTRILESSA